MECIPTLTGGEGKGIIMLTEALLMIMSIIDGWEHYWWLRALLMIESIIDGWEHYWCLWALL